MTIATKNIKIPMNKQGEKYAYEQKLLRHYIRTHTKT